MAKLLPHEFVADATEPKIVATAVHRGQVLNVSVSGGFLDNVVLYERWGWLVMRLLDSPEIAFIVDPEQMTEQSYTWALQNADEEETDG